MLCSVVTTLLSTVYTASFCLYLPTLVITHISDRVCFHECEVIAHGASSLYFPDGCWWWPPFHVPIDCFCIVFGKKMSLLVFCSFFNWVILFFLFLSLLILYKSLHPFPELLVEIKIADFVCGYVHVCNVVWVCTYTCASACRGQRLTSMSFLIAFHLLLLFNFSCCVCACVHACLCVCSCMHVCMWPYIP